jgi:valyl-tRNA synthetase
MAKDRLYDAAPENALARRSTQAAASDVLFSVLRLLAPFTPHVVEAVHQAHFRAATGLASVTRAPWPEAERPADDDPGLAAFALATDVLSRVRRWRSENKVSPGKPIERVRLTLPAPRLAAFAEVEPDVRAAGRVASLDVRAGPADLAEPALEITA